MQFLFGGFLAFGDFLKRLRGKKGSVSITLTGITLKFGGDHHALAGREIKEQVFPLDIPFQNKMGSGLLPDNLKGPDIRISEIKADLPFELLEVSPHPPVSVPYLSSQMFKLRVKSPSINYTGPLAIAFNTDSKENVNIDVSKLVLVDGKNKAEVEESSNNMILKRSQIIRRDIQVYKILKYGRKVSSLSINKPFEIASSEPAAPFTVDRKDSYVVKVFIKCPDFNYSGPLEISFK